MLASGLTTTIPPTTTPAPPAPSSIRITFAESADSAEEGLGTRNTSPNVTNESMVNDDLPIPIRGGGGTTQYQPSTDNDDTGSVLSLSHQGGGFTFCHDSPQRTANELPSVEETPVPGRQTKFSNRHHLCIHQGSVNTKQFTIAQKSCTLELAMEKKLVAQLEFENRDMTR
jgi:hypothetical protein